ncbi:MAG: hypothetical protein HYV63_27990 [Candidatus Schekmanbacteria bacterium]|nr:hypothetical protein [Candidatus Schekmanbacteria bacterium]
MTDLPREQLDRLELARRTIVVLPFAPPSGGALRGDIHVLESATPGAPAPLPTAVVAQTGKGDLAMADLSSWAAEELRWQLGNRTATAEQARRVVRGKEGDALPPGPVLTLEGAFERAEPGPVRAQFALGSGMSLTRAEVRLRVRLHARPENRVVSEVLIVSKSKSDELGLFPVARRAVDAAAEWTWVTITANLTSAGSGASRRDADANGSR